MCPRFAIRKGVKVLSRLDIMTPSRAQTVIDGLYRDVERRIAASPPGLCPVDLAMNFLNLCHAQTCGKCVPCREGTKRMLEILTRIENNEGSLEDLDLLEELSHTITETALCGLGQAACNPVVSTLKYFRKEYLAHVVDHHCPICNGRKRRLVIKPELCKGCGKCKRNCPMEAISGEIRMPHTIDNEKCIHCGACWGACPFGAIDAIEED